MRTRGYPTVSGSLSSLSPKTVIAAVLLVLMAVMWIRVLLRKSGPATATATAIAEAQTAAAAPAGPLFKVKSRPPAFIEGTHDRLHRDPFAVNRARWFREDGMAKDREETAVSEEERQRRTHEKNLKEIESQLTVEAILLNADGGRKAFVGGKVVTEGGVLKVARNGTIYELAATTLTDTEVIFTWQAFSISVHMSPSEWVDDGKEDVL